MEVKTNSYKAIFKATSIFGGVQMFNIFVTLVRSKAVAVLIGTAGMGLNGLFMSGLNLIKIISSLGISESAVRDISKAHASGDRYHIGKTFTVFKRWVWITAVLGILLTLIFSPLLSLFSFGTTDHTLSYILLSITFLFGALSGGVYTFLRGTQQIKYLAQANIFGAVTGLIVALPVFYFFGIKGVVPAIILTALGSYLVSLYFKNKVVYEHVKVNWNETLSVGKPMVQLGLSLTFISLLAAAIVFCVNAFISKTGSLSDVGLYSAGNSIVDGYVGMVFTAMATDYFPRLAGVIHDENKWKKLVNEQAELVIIILGIVLILLIATTPLLIRILLNKEFLASQNFIQFAILAIPLKGLVWVLGYIILAKGNNRLFIIVEVIGNLTVLIFNILFYHNFGLTGLGISLFVSFAIVTIYMLFVLKRNYDFKFQFPVIKLTLISMVSLSLILVALYTITKPYFYAIEGIIVIATIGYFIFELNKRIAILDFLKSKLRS